MWDPQRSHSPQVETQGEAEPGRRFLERHCYYLGKWENVTSTECPNFSHLSIHSYPIWALGLCYCVNCTTCECG